MISKWAGFVERSIFAKGGKDSLEAAREVVEGGGRLESGLKIGKELLALAFFVKGASFHGVEISEFETFGIET